MNWVICIPSYKRSKICNDKTLQMLHNLGIDKSKINVFVIEEEKNEYESVLDKNYYNRIIVGKKGLVEQRRFIENFYKKGKHIVFIDDDVENVNLSLILNKSLSNFIEYAFNKCIEEHSYIWGVYPVNNLYFMKNKKPVTTDLKFIVGAFYGIINRPYDEDLRLNLVGNKEDVERSIKYFIKDKIVLRFNHVCFKTKYYGTDGGGLGTLKERIDIMKQDSFKLKSIYDDYGKIKVRKNGLYEFVLNKIPSPLYEITLLKPYEEGLFDNLYNMLNKIILPNIKKGNRLNFPNFKGACVGLTRDRFTGIMGQSSFSVKYPEISEEIERIGIKLCPFNFTSVQLNHNLQCPLHKDSNNVSKSLLVSFGDYEGCNIVIDGKEYDAKKNGIIFNGNQLEHFNTPLISGNKYSLVFYNRNNH